MTMKKYFIKIMIEGNYTEASGKMVSDYFLELNKNISRAELGKLVEHNPRYIFCDKLGWNDRIQLTEAHRQDFPEYYL